MPLHPRKRRRYSAPPPVVATSNDGVLPLDLLYDVLLCLPAEALCRFRAVCRSWRSLLMHPNFIAAARNPGPLIAVSIKDYCSGNEVTVLDMESGDAVTDLNVGTNDLAHGEAHCTSQDRLVCVGNLQNRLRLLDLATGVVSLLPDHAAPLGYKLIWCTVGRMASTGEHKVLAVATTGCYHMPEVCKILTLGLSDGGWKDTGSPPSKVFGHGRGIASINGIAYFLSVYTKLKSKKSYAHKIMVFDFNNEAWRPAVASLRGPVNCPYISLAELDDHLVAGHATFTDLTQLWTLWFLDDSDRSLWLKRYTIIIPCHPNHPPSTCYEYQFEKPLAILDDGRIVLMTRVLLEGCSIHHAALRIYNPKTKTFKDGMVVPNFNHVSVFRWNLLHSRKGGTLDSAAKRLLIGRRHR